MLKIRGMSIVENFLTGVNKFGHCLTLGMSAQGKAKKNLGNW